MATRCRFFHHKAVFGRCKGNRIRLPGTLSLSPALGSVRLSSLTGCRTQGGMKLETPPPSTHLHSLVRRNLYRKLFMDPDPEWSRLRRPLLVHSYDVILRSDLRSACFHCQMWTLLIQAATTQCIFFNEWIELSAFHEAPLGNAIVHFGPHFVVISLFSHSMSSYLLIDSHDVQASFQGILEFHSFTRPSRASMSVGT